MGYSSKTKNIIVIYLLSTLIYYFFGRQIWIIPSKLKLLVFVIVNILSFYIGYTIYFNKKYNQHINYKNNQIDLKYTKNIRIIFKVSCILLIIFQIATVYTTLGTFSFNNVLQSIGENYKERLLIIRSYEGTQTILIMQIQTLFWGLTMFAYPIGYMYFKKMNRNDKILFIITVIIDIIATLNMGISKNIGDLILIIVSCILISSSTQKIKRKRHPYKSIVVIIVIFLIVFSMIQTSREKAYGVQTNTNLYPKFSNLREKTIFDIILLDNKLLSNAIDRIGIYVSHGYTGLAYAMELPYKNTYGIGFSRALTDYTNQYFGLDVSPQTYNARIQLLYGWPNGSLWPTAYTWIANSVSFLFVPIVIFLFGTFLAKVEYRYKTRRDIYSLALFCQLFIGAIYLPANAQLVQSRSSWWGFLLLIFIYFVTENKKGKNDTWYYF